MSAEREESNETMVEAEYLKQRLDDQIDWYDRKSVANQAAYKRLRLIEIIAAASIPLLAGFGRDSATVSFGIGVLGLIVAVLAGIVGLYRFQENWIEYRTAAESLKGEKYRYLARAEPYAGGRPFELLVQRVESVLHRETTDWTRSMRVSDAAGEAKLGPPAAPTD